MYLPDRESLKERFEQYSDEQLIEILKNRRDYQEQALEAAIETALARGLINSREDLFSRNSISHVLAGVLFSRC